MTIGVIILILMGLYLTMWYGALKTWACRVQEAWDLLQERYRRRYELIPGVQAAVRSGGAEVRDAMTAVRQAERTAQTAQQPGERLQAEKALTQALQTVFMRVAGSDIAGTQNVLEMQQEIADTQDQIQSAEQFYQGVATALNARAACFPGRRVARMVGIDPAETGMPLSQKSVSEKKT